MDYYIFTDLSFISCKPYSYWKKLHIISVNIKARSNQSFYNDQTIKISEILLKKSMINIISVIICIVIGKRIWILFFMFFCKKCQKNQHFLTLFRFSKCWFIIVFAIGYAKCQKCAKSQFLTLFFFQNSANTFCGSNRQI